MFFSLGGSANKGDSHGGSLKMHICMLPSSDPGVTGQPHRGGERCFPGGVGMKDPHPVPTGSPGEAVLSVWGPFAFCFPSPRESSAITYHSIAN